ncbi:MAG TPA: tellurite resistance/C4-dicarboxylate transporter family protein [Vicinamibacterales bacterium]|nr:tellurite resistance/C4-dicarboxylate transporter family protein [Vicinamibacterales bacterium]
MHEHGTAHDATRASFVADLHPAYFAMVMATGIVSIASLLVGFRTIGVALLPANVVFALVLAALTVVRVVRFPRRVAADLTDHRRAVGFFTLVAATAVLGSQVLLITGVRSVAAILWIVAIVLWAALTYGIFTALTVTRVKPTLAEGINGGWLVAVVAPQSIVVLGAQLASAGGEYAQGVLLFCLTMWLGAGMLYIWIISLIFYRYTFFLLEPSDLAPPYWINMGAVAISTLAGSLLVLGAPRSPLLLQLLPFLKGLTLLFWATATWWIPMLVILGVWRHGVERFPLRYDPLYWGAVFPLGMYTACTWRLSQAIDVPSLAAIPRVFIFIALFAWTLTFAGLAASLAGGLRRSAPDG